MKSPVVTRLIISSMTEEKEYYTLAQLSEKTGYHPVYLRRLVLAKKLDAKKVNLGRGNGFWVSTLDAIKEYQETKDNRGRPLTNSGTDDNN